MAFQETLKANIDFAATYDNLRRLGYDAVLSGGDFGNLIFNLNSPRRIKTDISDIFPLTYDLPPKIPVNISPKGRPFHKIQVTWNSLKERRNSSSKLTSILVPIKGEILTYHSWITTVTLKVLLDFTEFEKFFKEIDSVVQKYSPTYSSKEEWAQYEEWLDDVFQRHSKRETETTDDSILSRYILEKPSCKKTLSRYDWNHIREKMKKQHEEKANA